MKRWQVRVNARINGNLETVIKIFQGKSLAEAKKYAEILTGSYEKASLVDVIPLEETI